MKKNFLLLLFIYSLCSTTKAQIWCPPGATWYYGYFKWAAFLGGDVGYYKYEYAGDTTINAIACKKINKYEKNNFTETLFMYSDSDRIYLYRFNHFFTLYDFSANVGDTIVVPRRIDGIYPFLGGEVSCDTIGAIKIDSVGTTTINGENLRYIFVSPTLFSKWGYQAKIIEKIGPVSGYYNFFEPTKVDPSCLDFMEEPSESNEFRCYFDDNFSLYSIGTFSCDYTSSINESELDFNFTLFPNPVADNINLQYQLINSKSVSIEIKNLLGQIIYFEKAINTPNKQNKIINVSELPNGIYFIQLINGSIIKSAKFIKQ